MKKTVTRIMTALLCMTIIVSCFGICAFAEEPLKGSYVEFVKNDTENTISAKSYVRNPEMGAASTKAWLLLASYSDAVMEGAVIGSLELGKGVEDFITTAGLPYDGAKTYKAYLWYGDESCRPITPTATYGYDGQLLTGITIDGVAMSDFDPSVKEYKRAPGSDGVVPVTKGVTADNSIYTTTRYEQAGNDFIAYVTAQDSKKTKTEKYTITYTETIYDETNSYKAWHAISNFNGLDMTNPENWVEDPGTYNGWWANGSAQAANTRVILASNLHSNTDSSDANITGSRWITDSSSSKGNAKAQCHQLYIVPDEIMGLDYFLFNNNNRSSYYVAGTELVNFTINKPVEIVVYTTLSNNMTINDETLSFAKTSNYIQARYKEAAFFDADASPYLYDSDGKTGTLKPPYRGESPDYNWSTAEAIHNTNWIIGNYTNSGTEIVADGAYSVQKYEYTASKAFNLTEGQTQNISIKMTSNLSGRSPIIVIKPLANAVKPMFTYNMLYGGKTLSEFATANSATVNNDFLTARTDNNITTGDHKVRTNAIRILSTDVDGDPTIDTLGTNGKSDGDPTFDPTIVDNNYAQRHLKTLENVSGLEFAYMTATDREMAANASGTIKVSGANTNANWGEWEQAIFYATDDLKLNYGSTSISLGYPLTEKLTEDVLWQTFDVERDCEVFVFCTGTAPSFLDKAEYGWTKLGFNTASTSRVVKAPFTVVRGNAYQGYNGTAPIDYYGAYVKEYQAGDTVELYNANNGKTDQLPYMTVIRFK